MLRVYSPLSRLLCAHNPSYPFVIKRLASKSPVSGAAVEKFTKKVGRIQKKFGIKGTSKFLSLEREKWHLRQKQKETKNEMSANKEFRAINPDKDIVKFIESQKFGRRKPERVQKETRIMKYKKKYIPKLKFVAAAKKKTSFLPENENMPEVAFVGRSNVGKSTLINAFTSSGVARASDTPGETRSINWYQWAGKMYIVDLPGYGFSYSSVEQKQEWQDLMREYVTNRKTLRRIMLLLDARHGIKSSDLEMIELLNTAKKKFQIVLTKIDRVFPDDLARRCTLVGKQTKKYKYVVGPVMMASARRNMGMDRLQAEVERFAIRKPKKEVAQSTPTEKIGKIEKKEKIKKAEKSEKKDKNEGNKDDENEENEENEENDENDENEGNDKQPKKDNPQPKKDKPQPKPVPTLKDQWRKDEERKKKMVERKQKEQEYYEKHKEPELDRDSQGKAFLPSQRYRKGKRPKIKK